MGCDMYCAVEALNKKTGKWECFGISSANRDYSLFSRIADVRNSEKEDTYIEPIDTPRGLPLGDVSGPAKAWYDHIELPHSNTWLGRSELESLDRWLIDNEQGNLWERLGFPDLLYFFDFTNGWKKAAFTRYCDLRVLFFFEG